MDKQQVCIDISFLVQIAELEVVILAAATAIEVVEQDVVKVLMVEAVRRIVIENEKWGKKILSYILLRLNLDSTVVHNNLGLQSDIIMAEENCCYYKKYFKVFQVIVNTMRTMCFHFQTLQDFIVDLLTLLAFERNNLNYAWD